jgi:pimeloyl-ACP methyl ester carboxylesterase
VRAGHSFGGLYVLTFAARYPDEVAGMVLVDSTAPASAAKSGQHRPATGLLRHHVPCLRTGIDLGSTWSEPPVRPARTRQPAAEIPGRGTRQQRDRNVHRLIDGATHDSLISDEKDSAATTQAILDVVSSVRSAEPLDR